MEVLLIVFFKVCLCPYKYFAGLVVHNRNIPLSIFSLCETQRYWNPQSPAKLARRELADATGTMGGWRYKKIPIIYFTFISWKFVVLHKNLMWMVVRIFYCFMISNYQWPISSVDAYTHTCMDYSIGTMWTNVNLVNSFVIV